MRSAVAYCTVIMTSMWLLGLVNVVNIVIFFIDVLFFCVQAPLNCLMYVVTACLTFICFFFHGCQLCFMIYSELINCLVTFTHDTQFTVKLMDVVMVSPHQINVFALDALLNCVAVLSVAPQFIMSIVMEVCSCSRTYDFSSAIARS